MTLKQIFLVETLENTDMYLLADGVSFTWT